MRTKRQWQGEACVTYLNLALHDCRLVSWECTVRTYVPTQSHLILFSAWQCGRVRTIPPRVFAVMI